MPLLNQSSVGASTVTSSVLDTQDQISITANTQSVELFVDQLPNLVFYIVQISGAAPIEFTPQAALRYEEGVPANPVPILSYLDLSGRVVVPANGTPLLLNFRFPANYIRFDFFRTAGVTHTVKFVLAGFSP
jgi:hypothetical protein